MKKEVSPGMIAGIVAVIVLVIGFVAFKMFFQRTDVSPGSEADIKAYQQNRAKDAEIYQRTRGGMTRKMMGAGGNGQPSPPSGN